MLFRSIYSAVAWCTGYSHCLTRACSSNFNTSLLFHTLRRVKTYMLPFALNFFSQHPQREYAVHLELIDSPFLQVKSISRTTTFWVLQVTGLGFFDIKVIIRGKLGFYGRSKVLGFGEMSLVECSWTQPK